MGVHDIRWGRMSQTYLSVPMTVAEELNEDQVC